MANVQLILLERVENLGQMGDVVKVKLGYARNFLLPQKKAMRANKDNVAFFEKRRAQLEADNLHRRGDAEAVAAKMNKARVVMVRQAGETGQLYGSVSARDIAEGLTKGGFTVEKRQVVIEKPIKSIGFHVVRVVLHPEVSVTAQVNVAKSEEEAALQAERFDRGENPVVLRTDDFDEPAPAPDAEPEVEAAEPEAPAEAAPAEPAADAAPAEGKKAKKEKKAKA